MNESKGIPILHSISHVEMVGHECGQSQYTIFYIDPSFFIIFFYHSQLTILASYEIEYVGGIVDSG